VIAGFAAGIAIIISIIISSAAAPTKHISIFQAIHQDLARGIAINKATIEVRKVPDFGMTTGPPICRNELSQGDIESTMLGKILADADKGERKTHRLSPNEFIPIAKTLCVTKSWIQENDGKTVPMYPGWISLQSANGTVTNHKYWYGIHVYWNVTEKSLFKKVGPDYDGPMPKYDKVKVYIFASNSEFFYDENLLSDIQSRAVSFEPLALEPFGATPAGIVHRYNFTLVVPIGVQIYIDKGLKKPNGSSVAIKDLPLGTDFAGNFSQGSIPVIYDYDYVQVPAVWFVVNADIAGNVDSHVDEIRNVINEEISKCLEFKKGHPEREGLACPA